MKRTAAAFGLVAFLLQAGALRADGATVQETFREANEAFWKGDYEKARDGYLGIEELGISSADLSFNLGTAEARLGNLGRAIRHYERVLRRDPGHADATYNLSAIRDHIARRASEAGRNADLAPAAGPWRAILDRFSPTSAGIIFLVVHIALFAVLILRRFITAEMARLTSGVIAGVLLVLVLVMGAICLGKWDQETNLREAVVLARDTLAVVEGPSSEVKRFALEEGSRVIIVEETDGWLKIRDDQGRDGWAPAELVGEI